MSDPLSSDLASLRIDRDQDPDRKGPLFYVLIVVALVGLGAGAYFVALPYLEAQVFKANVELTEIVSVSPVQASIELTSTGYVVPQTVANVAAKVPGKVSKVLVKQGARVQAGDVLFELDRIETQAGVATSRSRVATARAQAQATRAQVAEGEQAAQRARALAEAGVGAKATAQDLEARVESLRAQVKAAEAQALAAQREVEALEIGLDNYSVRAPIDGTVLNKPPEVGELVGPAMGGIVTQLGGVELADFLSLVVESDVPEQRLHLVKLDGPCEITLDAFPDHRYRGKVREITPKVNRAKATVTVKVAFVDGAENVLPDMAARVSFLSGEIDAAKLNQKPKVVVPAAAVTERSGAKVVFVVDDGRARMRPIKLGSAHAGGFEVASGPPAGTRVVKGPSTELLDGQRIKHEDEE
jgi:HlyD family secretion protein